MKVGKKIIKKIKRSISYLKVSFRVAFGAIPSQAIGLTIFPTQTPMIMRSIHSNVGLSKQAIITEAIEQIHTEIPFNQTEINELYHLSVEYTNNYLSEDELIIAIRNLRGGSFVNVAIGLTIIASIIILVNNAYGFQLTPHGNVPPHLQFLYGNNYQPGQFGYKEVGPRSITVPGMTQNAGSEKKDLSHGSWDYKQVMRQLERQSSSKKVNVEVGNQIYTIKNPYRDDVYTLASKLADQIYDSIRLSDTDICDIAKNLGFKAENIKNVKNHVFYNKHYLDRYSPPMAIEYDRFDPDIQQALAWKRLETKTHTQNDITWIKHECAERYYELKYGSGYSEAHHKAQQCFDGSPWNDQF